MSYKRIRLSEGQQKIINIIKMASGKVTVKSYKPALSTKGTFAHSVLGIYCDGIHLGRLHLGSYGALLNKKVLFSKRGSRMLYT